MSTLSLTPQCSRCPRLEHRPTTIEKVVADAKSNKKPEPAVEVKIEGVTIFKFDELCETCKTIVTRYLDNAAKTPKHQSALRGDGVGEIEVD
jgi:hypothetical protein